MTLIIENGQIIENSDSYVTLAQSLTYATLVANTDWADFDLAEQQEPALVVAFNYLNTRWDMRYKGTRVRPLTISNNISLVGDDISFSGNNISSVTSDLSTFVDTGIIRIQGSVSNNTQEGTDLHITGTPTTNLITVTETLATELAGATVSILGVLLGQRGSWPRQNVVTPEGWLLPSSDIPLDIQNAQMQYAFVAVNQSLNLSPDPVYDETGRSLTQLKEDIGPIKTTKEWADASVLPLTTRAYPTADYLLNRWIISGGGRVIR